MTTKKITICVELPIAARVHAGREAEQKLIEEFSSLAARALAVELERLRRAPIDDLVGWTVGEAVHGDLAQKVLSLWPADERERCIAEFLGRRDEIEGWEREEHARIEGQAARAAAETRAMLLARAPELIERFDAGVLPVGEIRAMLFRTFIEPVIGGLRWETDDQLEHETTVPALSEQQWSTWKAIEARAQWSPVLVELVHCSGYRRPRPGQDDQLVRDEHGEIMVSGEPAVFVQLDAIYYVVAGYVLL